jgi:hypothetical protein
MSGSIEVVSQVVNVEVVEENLEVVVNTTPTSLSIELETNETVVEVSSGIPGPTGIQGLQGLQGDIGYSMLSGSGLPSPSIGVNNDHYIDTVSGQLYNKIAGAWAFESSLLGPSFSVGQVDGGIPSSIYGGTFVINGGVP